MKKLLEMTSTATPINKKIPAKKENSLLRWYTSLSPSIYIYIYTHKHTSTCIYIYIHTYIKIKKTEREGGVWMCVCVNLHMQQPGNRCTNTHFAWVVKERFANTRESVHA